MNTETIINPATDPQASAAVQQVQLVENRIRLNIAPTGILKIETPEQYRTAGEELVNIQAARKKLEETRKAMTRPIDAAKAAIMDFFRAPGDRLDEMQRKLKDGMLAYDRRQREAADKAQREADAQAQKDREFNEQRAARAVERGDFDTAEKAQQEAAQVVAPVITAATPSVKGVSMREVWRFKIEDESLVPREFLIVDQSKLRRHVENMKAASNVPGVRVYPEKIMAAGSR